MANKKRKQPKSHKTVKRQTRHFQLRVGDEYPVDAHVAEILDFKRSKRAEVTAIRDGVRLLWALENGDISVLFDMFPQYKAQFTATAPTSTNGGGHSDLAREIAAQIILQGGTPGYLMQSGQPQSTTGKQLAAPKFEMPVFEDDPDDQPTIIIQKSTSIDSSMNFVAALRGINN